MTREAILARIEELKKAQSEALASVNAFEGAIQDCLYWLTQLKE